ncbi:hypothetical protein RRG08_055200 [Elysia crispata]|uniref:SCAN box domain-containing protein n=1 Tax=Elysia crispata TaxID=231223 RepID=A0AAE0YVX1_9GAST|nr:hypothetical protein RRG08_055200 [Elysia crispata]
MYCRKAKLRLPLKSILEEYKCGKARLLSMLEDSEDPIVKTVQPTIKTGRKWKVVEAVSQAKECLKIKESVRGVLSSFRERRPDRQRFRTCSPEKGENPSMFIVRLKTYLELWMKVAEAPQTYEVLRDLFVKEQFLDSSPAHLSTYLRESRLADLQETAERPSEARHYS